MTEVRFYHLQRQRLEDVLPALLEKARERGHRIVVQAGSPERVKALDALLWTYRPESFLPHGSGPAAATAPDQPIWLTANEENPNAADVLVLVDGATAELAPYTLCCELFDGLDDSAVAAARKRWAEYKAAGHGITYWQQGERGGWEKRV
ncbi:MAG: polymerase subunit chi [Rhodospirillales bacterium]|nr:polymerase subunit chi [Rhodospirillales bacterium]